MYRTPTACERERWHAIWLLSQGWSAVKVARALGRNPHTIGDWLANIRILGPAGSYSQRAVASPALTAAQQAALADVLRQTPWAVGLPIATWT